MKKEEIDEPLLRHMALNTIRANRQKFYSEYGEIVICCDSKDIWRKEIFPYYKANRKKDRDASGINWEVVYRSLDKIREELKEFFPYRVIKIDTAEADDIIATLAKNNAFSKILIISSDGDFAQLQKYLGVSQWNPIQKKYIKCSNPDKYLKEHIIRGDTGDGVVNCLSDDNCLVLGKRQKPIMAKTFNYLMETAPEKYSQDILVKFKRNETLIDLDFIPEELEIAILEEYEKQAGKDRRKIMNYFIKNRMKLMMEKLGDF